MKKLCIILFLFSLGKAAHSQELSASDTFSTKLSTRMKDSLLLDKKQEAELFEINKLLASRKSQIRERYTDRDSLTWYIQLVENTRDSLYRPVLGDKKFSVYQKMKNILIGQ